MPVGHTLGRSLLIAAIVSDPLFPPSAHGQAPANPGLRQPVQWNQALLQARDEARAGLRSDKPNEVAWGTFRAGEYRLVDLVPDLVARLAAPPTGDDQGVYAVRAALLDSAVRLDAAVPAPTLRSYWKDFPVQPAILFAKATGPRDEVLLDLLTPATASRWFAPANLLLPSHPNGFTASALTPIRLSLVITVSEQTNAGSGMADGVAVGDGIGINPAGYPPRATYRFEPGPWPGNIVLSTGPRDVYYSRSVSYAWQFGVSEVYIGGPSAADRLRYVQADAFPLQAPFNLARQLGERHQSVQWDGDDALRRRVEDLRGDMLQAYRRFLASLVNAHRLTSSDAKSLEQPPSTSASSMRVRTSLTPSR